MSVSVTSLACKRAQQSCVVCAKASGTACCILLLIKMAMLEYAFWLHRSLSSEIRAWAVVSERLSWAACSLHGGQCAVFVAAHCPSEISTTAVRNLFGDLLGHTMTQVRLVFRAFELCSLIDGVARLGSAPSIGGRDCTKESPNAMALRCMCERINVKVANSFLSCCADLEVKSWRTRSTGQCALFTCFFEEFMCELSERDIDLTFNGSEDHSLHSVEFSLCMSVEGVAIASRSRGRKPCAWRMRDPDLVQNFQEDIHKFQLVF